MKALHYILITLLVTSILLNIKLINHVSINTNDPVTLLNNLIFSLEQEQTHEQLKPKALPKKKSHHSTQSLALHDNPTSEVETLLKYFTQALADEDYRLASEHISQAEILEQSLATKLKSVWITDIEKLLTEKKFLLVENAINAFFEYKFDDIDFLTLKVKLYLAQEDFATAIKHAYDIQYYLFESLPQQQSIETARDIAAARINQLADSSKWLELIELIEKIQTYDPPFDFYQWHLAVALFQLGEYEQALTQLSSLTSRSNYVKNAQELSKTIEQTLAFQESDTITIPLTAIGEHFTVTAIANDEIPLALLIDTGASITTISQQKYEDIAANTDVQYITTKNFNTAGGKVNSHVYALAQFEINGIVLENFQVSVNENFSDRHHDGLLGMNFLNQFDFHLDQNNHQLHLSAK